MATQNITREIELGAVGDIAQGSAPRSLGGLLQLAFKRRTFPLTCAVLAELGLTFGRSAVRSAHFAEFAVAGMLIGMLLLLTALTELVERAYPISCQRFTVVFGGLMFAATLQVLLISAGFGWSYLFVLLLHGVTVFGGFELFSILTASRYRRRVAIVGADGLALRMAVYLEEHPELRYDACGFIDRRGASRTTADSEGTATRLPVLGGMSDFESICRRNFIDEVFVTLSSHRDVLHQVIALGRQYHVAVRIVPDRLQDIATEIDPSFVGEFPTLAVNEQKRHPGSMFVKRTLDIAISTIGLLLLAPVFAVIAVILKLTSAGPVFYRSQRVGLKGKSFDCLKFRSMTVDAERRKSDLAHLNERDSILFKLENDPRITRVGKILRKFSLDELPQLINVLRGEMSLVGPRPSLPSEVNRYDVEALRRLEATPGITGLWQVKARRDPRFSTYLQMDLEYIDGWNLWLDLKILASTIPVVLAGNGR